MIYCPNCGSELPQGISFCPACGQPVAAQGAEGIGGSGAAPEGSAGAGPVQAGYPAPEAAERSGSLTKKLLPLLIAAAAVVVVAGIVLLVVLGRGTSSGGSKADGPRRAAVAAFADEDGVAWIPGIDGSCVKIKDEVASAYRTPDGKRVAAVTDEGELFIASKDLSKKEVLDDDADSCGYVSDKGFYYRSHSNRLYRYAFKDGSMVKVTNDADEIDGLVFSADGFGLLYVRDGKLYALPAGAAEPEKISNVDGSVTPLYFSDDGKTAIWGEKTDGKTYTVMLWDKGEKRKLGKADGQYIWCANSRDEKLFVFCGIGDTGSLLLWERGKEEAVRVKLEMGWGSAKVYTADGSLENASAAGVKELYVSCIADEGCSVYRVTLEGEKERILSRVYDWVVYDSRILWTKTDGTLLWGKLKGGEVAEETELDEEVSGLWAPHGGGKYLYYVKGEEEENPRSGDLYCYKIGEKAPVKVDSDVYNYYIAFSASGDSAVYFKDPDMDGYTGSLMTWSWGGQRAKAAADAFFGGFGSGLAEKYLLDPGAFWFLADTEDGHANLYFWNGKEKTKLASDIDIWNSMS